MHDDPALVLVVVDLQVVQPRVGHVGLGAAQREERLVDLTQPAVVAVVDFAPVELRPQERLGILRIRDFVGVPTVFGELSLAALGGGPGQLRLGMQLKNWNGLEEPHSSPMNSIAV